MRLVRMTRARLLVPITCGLAVCVALTGHGGTTDSGSARSTASTASGVPAGTPDRDEQPATHRRVGMRGLLRGAIAGLVATAAMTVAMEWMFQRLTPTQRFPLPPRFLTVGLAARMGVASRMDRRAQERATILAHYAFGASTGAIFPAIADRVPVPLPLLGLLYGVVVYLASYAGWVPALRLYPAPHDDAPHRTLLMVAAHLVWGSTLGIVEGQARRMGPGA